MDKRLTLEQLRVLGVLFSFRSKNTNTVWPSRQSIAERCGMHQSNISSATSSLERLGWLKKDGNGGKSQATRYTITVPDINLSVKRESAAGPGSKNQPQTVADSATVAEQATVAHSATPPVADSATPPVADSARGKELTSEQTSEHKNKTRAQGSSLFPDSVDPQVVADFLALRKAKRAEFTETAMKRLVAQVEIAGISLQEALELCCERGWQSFQAHYLNNSKPSHSQQRTEKFDPVAYVNRNRTRSSSHDFNEIDVTPQRVA